MKFKLDENIGRRGLELMRSAGHDVMTVREQNLQGSDDEALFGVCKDEKRVLVTLDHDFGQVLRFPPSTGPGVVIIEVGPSGSNDALRGVFGSSSQAGSASTIMRAYDGRRRLVRLF